MSGVMKLDLAYYILDMIQTMWDAAKQMELCYAAGNMEEFNALSMDLWDALAAVQTVSRQEIPEGEKIRLADACTCAMESLKEIKMLVLTKPKKVGWKLAYELEPIIETAAVQFYYAGIVAKHPGKREEFRAFLENTEAFGLLKKADAEREYACDMVIAVTGYNHLDYTMGCVQSILENMPEGVSTELVLLDHGSNDGTKAYFEGIENAGVIHVAVNGAVPGVIIKAISRGKYTLSVSNDVIIGRRAIENLYRCAIEHEEYGYIVPTTPAVSNLQTIPADYKNREEFQEFTEKNNVYDPKRHEQRVRLCNPVMLMPTLLYLRRALDMYENTFCHTNSAYSFPDDKHSLWMRRHGYRNILAKDAYCHHFGSVTIGSDGVKAKEKDMLYLEGRKEFYREYGIDPWGTGLCYEKELFDAWDIPAKDNVSILGLNCGIGGNSLKIKEVLKEKGARGTTLYNGTQEERFLQDLRGISDHAFVFSKLADIVSETGKRKFEYVIVDDPIKGVDEKELAEKLRDAGIEIGELAFLREKGRQE